MSEPKTNTPDVQEENSEKEDEKYIKPLQEELEAIKEFLKIILQAGPKENHQWNKAMDEIQLDLMDFLLRKRLGDEGALVRLSDLAGLSEIKRPSDMATEDVFELLIPEGEVPKKITEKVIERWHDSYLVEDEIMDLTLYFLSASSALSKISDKLDHKPSAEECDEVAKALKEAYIYLMVPRRMLEILQNFELPTFSAKQVDETDPTKLIDQIDKDVAKAIECSGNAIDWCENNSNRHRDTENLVDDIDEALGAIAEADAALKTYEGLLGKKAK